MWGGNHFGDPRALNGSLGMCRGSVWICVPIIKLSIPETKYVGGVGWRGCVRKPSEMGMSNKIELLPWYWSWSSRWIWRLKWQKTRVTIQGLYITWKKKWEHPFSRLKVYPESYLPTEFRCKSKPVLPAAQYISDQMPWGYDNWAEYLPSVGGLLLDYER